MRSLISHLRYTVRLLLKSPGFTITAVLILGLGIGLNTAIFSLVNGVLLKPLPYPRADRLVTIYETVPGFDRFSVDYPDYVDFRSSQRSFDDLAACNREGFTLTGRGEANVISGVYTTGSLFRVLGRSFLFGVPFGDDEARPVVAISERLWRSKLQQDPKVIGENLSLDGRSFEIIGVTPAQASEGAEIDVYLPLNQFPYFHDIQNNRGFHCLRVVGRLKDTATPQQARADLETISEELSAQYPATNTGDGVGLISYLDGAVGSYSTNLWLLEAAVGCLLLITCANVANLLVSRVQERRRELMIRAALGASKSRLFIQLLAETVILAFAGGIVGLVVAFLGVHLIKLLCPSNIPRFQEIAVDQGSLLFVLGLTLGTALLAGVLPALIGADVDLTPALTEGGERTGTAGPLRQRKQSFLVAGQVALTFVLLTVAGLLVRSYQALQEIPLGFNPHHVLTGDLYLRGSKYSDGPKSSAALYTILDRLRQLPGVTGVGLDTALPFKGGAAFIFGVAGQPDPKPGQEPVSEPQTISAGYFSILQIPLLRGRDFNDQDRQGKEPVVIVGQSLADHFFPGQNPIGKQLHDLGDPTQKRTFYTIVGVVPDVEHEGPDAQHGLFQIYYPYLQSPDPIDSATLVLSVKQDPNAVLQSVRKAITAIDPEIPFSEASPFDQIVQKSYTERRLSMLVVGLFSGAALLLAAVGLYAVLSYSVSQRRREIGVRIALGAQAQNILRLVITQGLRIGLAGLLLGVFAAVILTRFIQGLLYRVPGNDPLTFLSAAMVLCFAALAACLLPAVRATRVNPIKALRE